jgi:hypothetical protein
MVSPLYWYVVIKEGISPHRYGPHHTGANLQRGFAVQPKFRRGVSGLLTIALCGNSGAE